MLGLLVLLLVLLTYLEANEPEDLNWSPSYSAYDKIPLGSLVLYEALKEQDFPIQNVDVPPYEFLQDSTHSGTYFFLNDELNFDEAELNHLLSWIAKGNSAILIAENFSKNLLDTLQLKTQVSLPKESFSSKPMLNLSEAGLERDTAFLYDRQAYEHHFSKFDSLQQEVLGVSQLYTDSLKITAPNANFLRDSIGKGAIYVNSFPKAFSNYFMLAEKENPEYAARALAYITPQKSLFWDQYYKTGKTYITSPLFVLLNNRRLKWAYYFLLFGSILFIFFEGKRKQRSIKVIEPLKNQSFHFTRTVAGMFLERKDYKAITSKKIALFLEYIRAKYRLSTQQANEQFFAQLTGMSENPPEKVKELWQYMSRLEQQENVTKAELLELNKKITSFKTNKNGN
ncbi:MAG: DUF4350 domain-containing protein [Salinimicrobium sp.]